MPAFMSALESGARIWELAKGLFRKRRGVVRMNCGRDLRFNFTIKSLCVARHSTPVKLIVLSSIVGSPLCAISIRLPVPSRQMFSEFSERRFHTSSCKLHVCSLTLVSVFMISLPKERRKVRGISTLSPTQGNSKLIEQVQFQSTQ